MEEIAGAYETARDAAETGTEALRRVWPRQIPAMDPGQSDAFRDALRSLEDGWAALMRVAD